MTETFKQVAEQIKKLTPEEQQALRELLDLAEEEREWDELTSRPGAQAFHDHIRNEIRKAQENDEIEELDLGEDE